MAAPSDPRQAAAVFCRDGGTCPIHPLGSGNINHTFLVGSLAGPFVLQCINRQVFPEPLRVINNLAKVARHITQKPDRADHRFRCARPVLTLTGNLFHRDDHGDYWRGQTYLPAGTVCQCLAAGQAFRVGRVLAWFHDRVADLDFRDLLDPLPGFHDLPGYLLQFDTLGRIRQDGITGDDDYCRRAIHQGRHRATRLAAAKDAGELPLQVIHGDPKIDNFLFDDRGLADGMLDLDTVGSGIVHFDLGDCLRSCCNRGGESEGLAVSFDLSTCRQLLAGYLSLTSQHFSSRQQHYIFDAVVAITFELGVRFFTDHLSGNTYFKVRHDGENLLRAKRQFLLVEDIIAKEQEIRRLTK